MPSTPTTGFDLVLERTVALAPEAFWAAWTRPEHLIRWFTPMPWTTLEAEIDPRPGGVFRTVMRSPDGEVTNNSGCFLVAEAPRRLTWTSALGPGFQPNDLAPGTLTVTCELTFEADDEGTRYTARVMHATEAERRRHDEMGFTQGWTTALEQLVTHMTAVEMAEHEGRDE